MADFIFNIAKKATLDADIDHNAPADFRILLLSSATDEDKDDDDVQAVLARAGTTELTTSGTNYSRQTLDSETTTLDDSNDLAFFDAADEVFTAITQAAAETIVAALIYKFVTDDAGSTPIAFIDSGGFPITANGSDITFQWAAGGIWKIT